MTYVLQFQPPLFFLAIFHTWDSISFQELLTGNLVRQLYWRKSSLRLQRLPISLGRVVSLLLDKFSEIWTTERHLHHSDSSGIQTKKQMCMTSSGTVTNMCHSLQYLITYELWSYG